MWKERVVDRCDGEQRKKLEEQYRLIRHYKDYRDALVHGMWDWDTASPDKIKTIRVRREEVITVHFTAADLEEFSLAVARINFNVRYPRGADDWAEMMMQKGGHIGPNNEHASGQSCGRRADAGFEIPRKSDRKDF